ncbi:hypothetical protein [Haliangium sp.]|uniref:hypothetical protein n=1 Tax=Haliangium sp. TaxID=2663208 RepID=UPI003D11E63F
MSIQSTEPTHHRPILFGFVLAATLTLGLAAGAACLAPATACRCDEARPEAVPETAAPDDLAPGARVVARWNDSFWEATVVTVQGELVAVAWDQPPPDLSFRPRGWVVPMDAPPATASAGDWLLCPAEGGTWQLCHVEAASGDALELLPIADPGAGTGVRALDRAATLPIPDGLSAWAAARGDAALDRIRLAARMHGLVPATVGTPVRVDDHVLAEWTDGSWWEAKVIALEDGAVTVAWADGSTPMPLTPAQVAPLASAPRAGASGDLALCRWQQGTRWWRAAIDKGASGLEILYIDGTREPLHPHCVAARAAAGQP